MFGLVTQSRVNSKCCWGLLNRINTVITTKLEKPDIESPNIQNKIKLNVDLEKRIN